MFWLISWLLPASVSPCLYVQVFIRSLSSPQILSQKKKGWKLIFSCLLPNLARGGWRIQNSISLLRNAESDHINHVSLGNREPREVAGVTVSFFKCLLLQIVFWEKDKAAEIHAPITVPKCCKSRKPPGNSRFHLRTQDYIKRCPKCGQLDRNLPFPNPTQPNPTPQKTAGNATNFLCSPSPQGLPRSRRGMITGWGCLRKVTTGTGVDNRGGLAHKTDVQDSATSRCVQNLIYQIFRSGNTEITVILVRYLSWYLLLPVHDKAKLGYLRF